MSITIQFLISFLRQQIEDFDKRANSFRKAKSSKTRTGFTELIWNVCKDYARANNDFIEIEADKHSVNDHNINLHANFRRISGLNNLLRLIFEGFSYI